MPFLDVQALPFQVCACLIYACGSYKDNIHVCGQFLYDTLSGYITAFMPEHNMCNALFF